MQKFNIILGQIDGYDVELNNDGHYGILLKYHKCIKKHKHGGSTWNGVSISVAGKDLENDFDIHKAEKLIRQMKPELFIENYQDIENQIMEEEAEWIDPRNK